MPADEKTSKGVTGTTVGPEGKTVEWWKSAPFLSAVTLIVGPVLYFVAEKGRFPNTEQEWAIIILGALTGAGLLGARKERPKG